MIDLPTIVEKIYDEYLTEQNKKHKEKYIGKEDWFGASTAGTCIRKQWYRINGEVESDLEPRVKRLLRLGTIVHEDVEKALKKMGNPVVDSEILIEQRIEIPEYKVIGHFDIAFVGEKITLFDIKTSASYKWKKNFGINSNPNADENYKLQISTYAIGLLMDVLKDKGKVPEISSYLLYYNKDNSAMRSVYVDNEWIEGAHEYWQLVNSVINNSNGDPDNLVPGEMVGVPFQNWECRYCNFKHLCPGI